MASRRKEKQKRKVDNLQAEKQQVEKLKQQVHKLQVHNLQLSRQVELQSAEPAPADGAPRIMCSACREAGREASTLFCVIECNGCPGGCGGDHLALICSACGAPSAVMAEDLIASMVDPATCAACGKVFDMGKGGGGVGTNIGAPPGVDELYYCPLCAF